SSPETPRSSSTTATPLTAESTGRYSPRARAARSTTCRKTLPRRSRNTADHRMLYSTGSRTESRAWLEMQRGLVQSGRIDEAMMNDINDVLSRFPGKYNNRIADMIGSLGDNQAYQDLRTVPGNVSVQM